MLHRTEAATSNLHAQVLPCLPPPAPPPQPPFLLLIEPLTVLSMLNYETNTQTAIALFTTVYCPAELAAKWC